MCKSKRYCPVLFSVTGNILPLFHKIPVTISKFCVIFQGPEWVVAWGTKFQTVRRVGKILSHIFELCPTAYVQCGVMHFCVEGYVCFLGGACHKVYVTVLGASECNEWHWWFPLWAENPLV